MTISQVVICRIGTPNQKIPEAHQQQPCRLMILYQFRMHSTPIQYSTVTVFDQFSYFFDDVIEKYQTPKSICGYTVMAIASLLCTNQWSSARQMVAAVSLNSVMPFVEHCMIWLQERRKHYADKNKFSKKQQGNYLRDWVANYEIEDYLGEFSPGFVNKAVFFFRQVGYDHPDLMGDIKHEEADRIKVEQPFKGQTFFVTKFNGVKHLTLEQWKEDLQGCSTERPIVIITDLLGHFTTMVYFRKHLIMADTTSNKYKNAGAALMINKMLQEMVGG